MRSKRVRNLCTLFESSNELNFIFVVQFKESNSTKWQDQNKVLAKKKKKKNV
jgi:hypothetical protein